MIAPTEADGWTLAGRSLSSRLMLSTGRFKNAPSIEAVLEASGAEVVTFALRRVDLKAQENLLSTIDRERSLLLPNTAGCYTAEEAIRTLRLAREGGMADWVKLEIIGDPKTLLPDNEQTLRAARQLLDEGFTVLPYVSDDPIVCRKLEDMGCAAVMPLASPSGSGMGIRNAHNLRLIVEQSSIPVILDAGIGTASDAAIAMELGCHAVLVSSAIAEARQPALMAEALRHAVIGGRKAYLAGRMAPRGAMFQSDRASCHHPP